jgi:SAM-dependent methyltransferase
MNRKQRRASERRGGMASLTNANTPAEPTLTQLFAAAMAQHRAGAIAEAESRYRHILARFPDHAETHGMLGVALATQDRIHEAIPYFERTAALKPDVPGACDDLAKAYLAAGKPELAIEAAGRALELEETERRKAFFAHCAKSVSFTAENARVRKLLLRALIEGWARPRELTRACLSLIVLDDAVRDAVAQAQRTWPRRLPEAELFGSPGMAVLVRDDLLCRLLESDPITDLGLERLLTNIRLAILTRAESGDSSGLLAFYCSIARQCFINEYVFSLDYSEAQQAQHLRASLERALAANEECPPHRLAIAGAYFPLHTLPNAEALLERNWPSSVAALLVQQVKEPAEERAIAPTIAALTGIDDEVSRSVREHYEESPYPRWSSAEQPTPRNERQPEQSVDVLIAGCGTGLSTTVFARNMRQARILAIDLSLASLSYAKRMAQKFALTNIEFAQADITRLGALGRQFDFIDASGVLHHLADPWEGWRVLLSLLRSGGTMQISLYSELARRNVVAGRALIAERGYRPIAHDIRLCREEIAAADDGSKDGLVLKSLTRSDDFFSTSECRDLLFHPQEHRLTLPEIKTFLATNNLQFLGFALPAPALQRFARRFPDRNAMADLDCWHTFETEAPDTFAAMYQFSVRKP